MLQGEDRVTLLRVEKQVRFISTLLGVVGYTSIVESKCIVIIGELVYEHPGVLEMDYFLLGMREGIVRAGVNAN